LKTTKTIDTDIKQKKATMSLNKILQGMLDDFKKGYILLFQNIIQMYLVPAD